MATQPGRLNPYKLGLELFRDIERRWNKGQFGPEWEACEDMAERNSWDRELGLGRQKIYEVRRVHCDATFLDEFLTPEFCEEQKLFVSREQEGQVSKSKQAARALPRVQRDQAGAAVPVHQRRPPGDRAVDANFGNRGELLLRHRHVGVDLRWDWAKEVLGNLTQLWRRPVLLETRRGDKTVRLAHDGENASEETLEEQATPASKSA